MRLWQLAFDSVPSHSSFNTPKFGFRCRGIRYTAGGTSGKYTNGTAHQINRPQQGAILDQMGHSGMSHTVPYRRTSGFQ